INDGVEFLALRRFYTPPETLENAWVTLDGDVKVGGHEDWKYVPEFHDEHREEYLQGLACVAVELMSKIKVKTREDFTRILERNEVTYPDCVKLLLFIL
ncbi:hypothetical protein MPH_13701, partial [Macrophomina phaseolina MS6]